MPLSWQTVHGSTLVAAAAYDAAAHRLHVRLHSGRVQYFDECHPDEWATFMAPTTGKGQYLTAVLARKPGSASSAGRAPRTPLTEPVQRAVYLNAFRPAQEMSDPRFFAGRHQQVREVADALQVVGSCPLIYGDRGLGKSSLAVQTQLIAMGDEHLLTQIGSPDRVLPIERSFLTVFVSCSDSIRSLNDLLQALINAIEDIISADGDTTQGMSHLVDRSTRKKVTFKVFELETTKSYAVKKERGSFENLSVIERLQRLVRLLNESYDQPVLLIVDELDRMRDKDGLSSTIKRLSTEDLKFLLVGIAQDWSDLLLDHASLERQIAPVKVPRMRRPELAEIVDLATAALKSAGSDLRFSDEARKRLVDVAGGFPWFVHVLGQAALLDAVESGLKVVTQDQVAKSMRNLVTNRFAQHFSDSYQRAVRDSINGKSLCAC